MRDLVSVRQIGSISPIENADNIERALVGGWCVVVRKGKHRAGDLAVYFEIDAALPINKEPFAFLAERHIRTVNNVACHVLKTIRLRKVLSQGLLLTPEELGLDPTTLSAGQDLTESFALSFGVSKYEPPLPNMTGGDAAGVFPTKFAQKTDAERVQNLEEFWDEIQKYSWVATEKIDGTSATFVNTEDGMVACSRNWSIKEGDNLYWNVVDEHGLKELMPIGSVLQGEIYGEGVQGNRLGVKGRHIAVFNVGGPEDGPIWEASLPMVPCYEGLELPETIEDAIAQADGIKSLTAPSRLAEGIVWRNTEGRNLDFLGNRPIFKVVSNKYLLKEKD